MHTQLSPLKNMDIYIYIYLDGLVCLYFYPFNILKKLKNNFFKYKLIFNADSFMWIRKGRFQDLSKRNYDQDHVKGTIWAQENEDIR